MSTAITAATNQVPVCSWSNFEDRGIPRIGHRTHPGMICSREKHDSEQWNLTRPRNVKLSPTIDDREVLSVSDRWNVPRISSGGVVSAPRFQRFVGFVLAALTVIGGRWSSAQEGIDLRGRLDASPGGTLLGNRPGPSIGRTPRSAYIREDVLPPVQPDRLGPLDHSRLPCRKRPERSPAAGHAGPTRLDDSGAGDRPARPLQP